MTPLDCRRAAVIGATGFIGSHLAETLAGQECEVLALSRTDQRAANLTSVGERVRPVQCDILDKKRLADTLGRFHPDVVFHMAAYPDACETFEHMAACVQTNVLGTLNALEAAALAGARRFVLSDSCKIYGNSPAPFGEETAITPICSYAIAKSAGWQMCLLAEWLPIEIVALRPSFVYGPRQGFNLITYVNECVRDRKPVRLLGGSQTRDPLYVADAVQAFLGAACAPGVHGRAIPIGGGRDYPVVRVCREILAVLGSDLPIEENALPPRKSEIWRTLCDNAAAMRLLGWAPQTSLADGLRLTLLGAGGSVAADVPGISAAAQAG